MSPQYFQCFFLYFIIPCFADKKPRVNGLITVSDTVIFFNLLLREKVLNIRVELYKVIHPSHNKRQKKIKMKYRSELEHDGNFVFCRVNGYPYIQKNIVIRMARLLEFTH